MSVEGSPPEGYVLPTLVWCVEYVDPRQPEEGSFQRGAFTTEAEAQKLVDRSRAEGFFVPLRINMVAVHQRIEDWDWDR